MLIGEWVGGQMGMDAWVTFMNMQEIWKLGKTAKHLVVVQQHTLAPTLQAVTMPGLVLYGPSVSATVHRTELTDICRLAVGLLGVFNMQYSLPHSSATSPQQ